MVGMAAVTVVMAVVMAVVKAVVAMAKVVLPVVCLPARTIRMLRRNATPAKAKVTSRPILLVQSMMQASATKRKVAVLLHCHRRKRGLSKRPRMS